jgi:uncharacterized protein (TIGR03083 family)
MTHDEYLALIRAEVDDLRDLAGTAALDTVVPSCPDWTIEQLVEHVGGAHRFATGNLGQGPDQGPKFDYEPRAEGRPVTEWLDVGAEALLEQLASVGPSQPCWTLDDTSESGFWARRATHETAVHLWDARNAAGAPQPIPGDVAVDGIDELLGLLPALARFRQSTEPWGDGETVHLHATDAPGEWLLRLDADGLHVTREHAKGDVAARGAASDLLLFMMGRQDTAPLEVFGDAALLDRLRERARF